MNAEEKQIKLLEKVRANREARKEPPKSFLAQLAESRGWRISEPFELERLFARKGSLTRDKRQPRAESFDHFRRDGFPWAVLAHCPSYAEETECCVYAQRHGLLAEVNWCRSHPECTTVLM